MTSFTELNLHSNITKAIHHCGYQQPTPIQARCIPDILNGKDLVASAQTGTGKTAAFVLPALERLTQKRQAEKPRVLILTPTRELAQQINHAVGIYGKFLRFNTANLVGGTSYYQQIRSLSRAVDLVVATPGRLLDHVRNGRLDLSGIELLIVDEADRMLDMGFIEDVEMIASKTPGDRQTLLFSATMHKITHLTKNLLRNPTRIDLTPAKLSPLQIKQTIYLADNFQHKIQLLEHFFQNDSIFKAIIFSSTKVNADELARRFHQQGFKTAPLHGNLSQSRRDRHVADLQKNKLHFLFATDVAARGIHINDLTHVINFDLPRSCEDYVHRIGRTGRAGNSGIAISLVSPTDAKLLTRIEKFIGQTLPKTSVSGLEAKTHHFAASSLNHKKPSRKKTHFSGKHSSKNKSHFAANIKDEEQQARSAFSNKKKKIQAKDQRTIERLKPSTTHRSAKRNNRKAAYRE